MDALLNAIANLRKSHEHFTSVLEQLQAAHRKLSGDTLSTLEGVHRVLNLPVTDDPDE